MMIYTILLCSMLIAVATATQGGKPNLFPTNYVSVELFGSNAPGRISLMNPNGSGLMFWIRADLSLGDARECYAAVKKMFEDKGDVEEDCEDSRCLKGSPTSTLGKGKVVELSWTKDGIDGIDACAGKWDHPREE